MVEPADRGARFLALHVPGEPLLLPNPWDAGSARLLTSLGFDALGTTSLGVANVLGRRRADLEAVLDNCRTICRATHLPVTADLENGFGDAPEHAARAVRLAAQCGAAGVSIEDATGNPSAPIYDFGLAVERVAAAVEAAGDPVAPVVLTARAENLLHGIADLDDTVRRLQAFEAAGADVLYAPGLKTLDEIRFVTSAVSRPVNVVMGFADPRITLADLAQAGVARVSIGGALSRIALAACLEAAAEMRSGHFSFVGRLAPIATLHEVFV